MTLIIVGILMVIVSFILWMVDNEPLKLCSILTFAIAMGCILTGIFPFPNKAKVEKRLNQITQTVKYVYNLPEEMSQIKEDQRLYCDSIREKDGIKTIYMSFDQRAYYLEFSNTKGYINMTDNNRLVHTFDSTSEVYQIMMDDNQ